jgi:heavy metal response regulator
LPEEGRVRVLVVEDEHRMAAYIGRALTEASFAVDVANDGARGLDLARTHAYDAIVLDVMLPNIDGLTLCRALRKEGNRTPVIMLTARDLIEDRVRGLDAGADDYLIKPFAVAELSARLRALQRRQQPASDTVLRVADLTLDPASRTAARGGRPITLTAREYSLLEYLMRRAGSVLTRTMIAEHVWEFSFDHVSNVVDVYIKHLRDKIDVDGRPSLIQAVRGIGYVLRDPRQADT